jgi:hypothetical protein
MSVFRGLTGQTLGHWTVLQRVENSKSGKARFLCRCECGTERAVVGESLTRKRGTRSCGCQKLELIARAKTKHGHARKGAPSPEYSAYIHMLARCYNTKGKDYLRYGGRGITVCDRWRFGEGGKGGFECFLADMGTKPSDKHSLDRIDVNGKYEPSGCRWATPEEQQNNKRNNALIEINGCIRTKTQWCGEIGWSREKLKNRVRDLNRLIDRVGRDVPPFPDGPDDPMSLTTKSLHAAGFGQFEELWLHRDDWASVMLSLAA